MIEEWVALNTESPVSLYTRQWLDPNGSSAEPPFVLLHGLASNARTWDAVAARLAAKGHRAIAVDQRGHGLSDKPDAGYDFVQLSSDLAALLDALKITRPILIGQSWGGNVVLAFGTQHPERVRGLGFVDGGYLDLQMRPHNSWEQVAHDLKPPPLLGTPATALAERMRRAHPDWSQAGIDATMANFEVLADGTVRPWLTLDRHMRILRALWEQRPATLYRRVQAPVYIAVAEKGPSNEWAELRRRQVEAAQEGIAQLRVHRFAETDHDIHVHRPDQLADALLSQVESGIWSSQSL